MRGIVHLLIYWGCIELFFVGSLGNMLADAGWISLSKDAPWFAVANEIGGLAVLAGGLLAIALSRSRRGALRPEATAMDAWLPPLLLLAVLSGYAVEAARLAAGSVSQPAYSFVGAALAPLVRHWAAEDLESAWRALWWVHAVVGLGLFAAVPYSKLFHLLATPLYVLVGSEEPAPRIPVGTARAEGDRRSFGWRERLALDACTHCLRCVEACEAVAASPEPYSSPAKRLRAFLRLLKWETMPAPWRGLLGATPAGPEQWRNLSFGTFHCTTCGRCTAFCPASIDLVDLWLAARNDLARRTFAPRAFGAVAEAVRAEHNIADFPNADRARDDRVCGRSR